MNSKTIDRFLESIELAQITPESFKSDILDDEFEYKREYIKCVNGIDYYQYGDSIVAIHGSYGAITRLKKVPKLMTEEKMIIASCRIVS